MIAHIARRLPIISPPISHIGREFRFLDRYKQGIPPQTESFWSGKETVPADHDWYPEITSINRVTLTIFKDSLVEVCDENKWHFKFCESTVTLQTSDKDYVLGLHLFPICRLKKQVSSKLEICLEDNERNKTPLSLPFNLSTKLLTYLIEGKPQGIHSSEEFTCVQFATYLQGIGKYATTDNKIVMKPHVTKEYMPGDMSLLADVNKVGQCALIHLGKGLCIRHAGPHCLRISSFQDAQRMAQAAFIQTLRRQS